MENERFEMTEEARALAEAELKKEEQRAARASFYMGPGLKVFMAIHKRVLALSGSYEAVNLAVYHPTPENTLGYPRVPAWFEDDGEAWWKPTDDIMRAEFGYVPMRIVYKDARDMPAELISTHSAPPTLH